MYVRLFAAVWLLVCAFLAVVAWGFQAPFSYDPVGPRAYPLLLLTLMAAAALWLLCKPSGEPTLPISWVLARKVGLCVGAGYAFGNVEFVKKNFEAVLVAIVVYPYVRIVRRTGHSGWWILTMFVPVLNFIMLWVFAFARWPATDDRQR